MSEPKFVSFVDSIEPVFRSGDTRADEKQNEAANVRLIKGFITAIGRNDLAAAEGMMADNVTLEILGVDELPFIRKARGQAGLLEAIRQNYGALKDQRPNIEAVIAQGDTVIFILREEGEIQASGQKYRIKGFQRFVIREGKIESMELMAVSI
jgi:ketosteroid isomerase-like protein